MTYTRLLPQQTRLRFALLFLMCCTFGLHSTSVFASHPEDPHYNNVGFFDIHVCNWPKRPLFLMALFSTTEYDHIQKIEIIDNNNKVLGKLNLTKYRPIKLKNTKKEKRVFLKQIDIPKSSTTGWYSTKVTMKDGKIHTAKDYVIIQTLGRAKNISPAKNTTLNSIPTKLTWDPIPGAHYYQAFITDMWNENKVYSSNLLSQPEFTPPKDLLKKGDAYCLRIHARDVNEHQLLGDFNHGSLTACNYFEIK